MVAIKTFILYSTIHVHIFNDITFSKMLMGSEFPIINIINGNNMSKLMINDYVLYIQITEDIDDNGYFNVIILNKNKDIISPKFSINPFNASIYDMNIELFSKIIDDNISLVTNDENQYEHHYEHQYDQNEDAKSEFNISVDKEKTEKVKDAIMNPSSIEQKSNSSIDINERIKQLMNTKGATSSATNSTTKSATNSITKSATSYASIAKKNNEYTIKSSDNSVSNEITTDTEGTEDTELSVMNIHEQTDLAKNTFIDIVKKFIQKDIEYYDLKEDFK